MALVFGRPKRLGLFGDKFGFPLVVPPRSSQGSFLEILQKRGENGWLSKRTMVEKNGEPTPRFPALFNS